MAVSEQGRGAMGQEKSNYCVSGGCLLSVSMCRRGIQDLLNGMPSSPFMMCRFNGFPDESVHVSGFSSKKFCIL